MLAPHRCQVAKDLFWGEGGPALRRDRMLLRCLEALAAEHEAFLDIGSYTGLFSLIAARANPRLSATAFELVPETWLLMARNVIANDLVRQITPRLRGVSEVEGEVRMPVSLKSASLPSGLSLDSGFSGGVSIPVGKLDQAVAGRTFIKLDVEGHEAEVLRSSADLLATRPDILCEITPATLADIKAILAPLGYRFHRFTEAGLVESGDRDAGVKGRDWWLTCRADAGPVLEVVNGTP